MDIDVSISRDSSASIFLKDHNSNTNSSSTDDGLGSFTTGRSRSSYGPDSPPAGALFTGHEQGMPGLGHGHVSGGQSGAKQSGARQSGARQSGARQNPYSEVRGVDNLSYDETELQAV